jgi:peptide/nickel transport system permease protein
MLAYIIRRLILAVFILFLTTLLVFFAMRLLPGDPILMLITENQAQEYDQEQIDQLKREFGLDKPMIRQYLDWIGGVLKGDLGVSILHRSPVEKEILRRLPISLYVGGLAFIIGHLIGIPAGIIAAIRRGKWLDNVITTLANIGITVPNFWLGILMSTKQLVMPVICLSLFPICGSSRQARSSMLEVMRQDYMRTAWSKGLRERTIIIRHGLKNGLIPIVTLAGMGVPMVIGGAMFIETVFNIPGIGRLAVDSVTSQDYPYVQAITLMVASMVVLVNLVVDIAYGWLDPRIRYE